MGPVKGTSQRSIIREAIPAPGQGTGREPFRDMKNGGTGGQGRNGKKPPTGAETVSRGIQPPLDLYVSEEPKDKIGNIYAGDAHRMLNAIKTHADGKR